MPSILLVSVAPIDGELIRELIPPLQKAFRTEVTLRDRDSIDPVAAFDPLLNQYNSTIVISSVLEKFGGNTHKVLGITSVDLFRAGLDVCFRRSSVGRDCSNGFDLPAG